MQAVNKVIYNGKTLIDLTADTVISEMVLTGETCHSMDGMIIVGTLFSGYPDICPVPNRLLDHSGINIFDGKGKQIFGETMYKKQ